MGRKHARHVLTAQKKGVTHTLLEVTGRMIPLEVSVRAVGVSACASVLLLNQGSEFLAID